jgi:uncharacterized cupin superfamily protein
MSEIIMVRNEGEDTPAAEHGRAGADVLLRGEYKTTTYNHFTGEDGRLYCGIWECTPGKVRIDYTEWEFCHLIEGEVVLTNESGRSWRLGKGDGLIIPPGFKGTWETVKFVRKHYVILTPKN